MPGFEFGMLPAILRVGSNDVTIWPQDHGGVVAIADRELLWRVVVTGADRTVAFEEQSGLP